MGAMKRYAEQVSVELGYDGELNDEVLQEAQRRLDKLEGELRAIDPKWDENLARQAESEYKEEQCQRQRDSL